MKTTKTKATKEDVVLIAVLILLLIGMLGLPVIRYAVYAIPVVVILIWTVTGKLRFCVNRQIAPFLILFFFVLISMFSVDYNWAKKAYFIAVYLSIFLLFDLSKANIDVKYFNYVFILAFLIKEVPKIFMHSGGELAAISLLDSKSLFENTLSFPLGMFAVFYLSQKRYRLFGLNMVLALLAFKRAVMLGALAAIFAMVLPKWMKRILINPFVMTALVLVLMVLFTELAAGEYDKAIQSYLGISTNHLLMGRQALWSQALTAVKYNPMDFFIYGVGHSKVTSILQQKWGGDVLLHSDFLLILLEHGYIVLAIFTYLLFAQKTFNERYLAIYLAVQFLTDNVMIYQHVMIPFFLLLAVLRKEATPTSDYIPPLANNGKAADNIAMNIAPLTPERS